MIRKSWFLMVGIFLLSLFLANSAQGQDKKDPSKKEDVQKEEVIKLKKEISLIQRQNQLLKMRIKTLSRVLDFYRKRLRQSQNPIQNIQKQAQFILGQFQRAFMKKGIKGVVELFQKILQQFKRKKQFVPRKRSDRSM